MPNYCQNQVVVKHENSAVLRALVKAFEEGHMFEYLIPVPSELKRDEVHTWPQRGTPEADAYERMRQENVARFGFANAIDFCYERWGTKWDVEPLEPPLLESDTSVWMAFDTAWAPAIGIYEAMTQSMGFQVTAHYFEPGCGFVGTWSDGVNRQWNIGDSSIPRDLIDRFHIEDDETSSESEHTV